MTGYLPRQLAGTLSRALATMPVVIVTGMRQTGKTTFLENDDVFAGRRYETLDDFATLEMAASDPRALLAGDGPLSLDEVQRSPQLLLAIKREIDRDRRAGRFVLSGSANLALLRDVSETLAGRALYLQLDPLTAREVHGRKEPPFLLPFFDAVASNADPGALSPAGVVPRIDEESIRLGGMPPVRLNRRGDPDIWFEGFEQTYLERDLRSFARVEDVLGFRNLLQLCAHRSSAILNQSELGREARLNAKTAGRYLGLMEASFVVHRLPPYLRNRASRVIKAPKLYLADSGLAAYLIGAGGSALPAAARESGALLETYVFQNLRAIREAYWRDARLHYWHVQGRYEVDFIIESKRGVLAIELKQGTRWSPRDLAGLEAFLESTPRCVAGILAHGGDEYRRIRDRVWAMPAEWLIA